MENYEQKYKKALEWMQSLYDGLHGATKEDAEHYFPELQEQESEDERIRKWLIDWARAVNWSEQFTITKEQVIAWLEKQKATGEEIIFRPIVGTDIRIAAKQALEKIDIGKKVVLAFNGAYIPVNGKTVGEIDSEYDAWLEKQGEQTQLDYEYADIPQKDFAPIEPKFKVGDWIVQENIGIYKVIEVCESWYEVVDNKDEHYSISFNKEYMCHLWSINDAKNGDVLVAKGGYFKEYVFKFSSFTEDNVISTHFGYDVFHGNFDTKLSRFGREEDFEFVNPATKEQRDLLFSKMKEAGYEWDADKKELKKIEPKTLNADKVIEWMCHNTEYFWNSPYTPNGFINQFKKDFGL